MLKKIQEICEGMGYRTGVPIEAFKLAEENNIIIIIGGSDDLMYCYGANSFLTEHEEHGEGWDGCDLSKDASEPELLKEAKQLGLKIFWEGKIEKTGETIKDYDSDKMGAFSYKVNENLESVTFKVVDDEYIYCTGIIIQLPNDFESAI